MQQTESRSRPSSSRSLRRGLVGAGAGVAVLIGLAWAQQPPDPAQTGAPPQNSQIIIEGAAQQRLAVPDCIPRAGDQASREACRTFTQVLRRDLAFENFFQFVPENLMATLPAGNPDAPNFENWRSVGAEFLVSTRAQVAGGEMMVDVQLHQVNGGQAMLTKRYTGRAENPRTFAHQASDEILAAFQQKGVARTKIAFSSDRDSASGKVAKELYIVDYDGFNPRRVTVNRSINILPSWRPDGRALGYISYRQGAPDLFLASIYEGKSSNITGGKGQTFAFAFSPDGKRVAYSSSRSGNADIWVANADGSNPQRLTTSAGLDTAPTWSPTGQEIAFTSDRAGAGAPQIYVMDSEGLNVRRLTTVGNYNDAPAWNPSKQYPEIAYTSRLEGGFQIAVVKLDTREVRQVTTNQGSCEYPSWAPSGRHLVFACKRDRRGPWRVVVSDREGRRVDVLPTGEGNNAQPDWGPSPGS
jgi:TolB protein